MDELSQIEQKFGFTLPPAYRAFARRGYTGLPPGPDYLWVHEAEWTEPAQILDGSEFYIDPKPGLVPFAFTGGHDLWCWQTQRITEAGEPAIVFCPRDCEEGWWHAPSFLGWLYRVSLEYVAPMWDDEPETRENLRRWASLLREFGQPAWADEVADVARRPMTTIPQGRRQYNALLTPEEVEDQVRRSFGDGYVDSPYMWHLEGA